ncbi:PEPxxWA-CTERM sorting domain-containing protein [Phenylobacterium sp.]|uniref:PEPxxWA-CTERM sorting domain-containing protein n=1 Tax=Phenylobacterium sp. TaxID=1871053 RepID=UPI0039C8EAE7
MRLIGTLLCTAAIAAFATSANAVMLYQNNFDGNESHHAGVTGAFSLFPTEAASAGAWNAQGWAGNYGAYRTGGTPTSPFGGLYLSNLATHTTVSASFILGFLESWDSYDGGCCSPDNLEIWLDGVKVANMTYNNALGTVKDTDGGTVIHEYVQANTNGYYSDTLVDMGTAPFLTFAHTASTLSLEFRAAGDGWQGGSDEGFGLDNVVLTYDGVRGGVVPEPATWALMIGGFGMAGAMLRRRRTALV